MFVSRIVYVHTQYNILVKIRIYLFFLKLARILIQCYTIYSLHGIRHQKLSKDTHLFVLLRLHKCFTQNDVIV